MMQETLVPEFTITTSREYWEQKTYEEIKKTPTSIRFTMRRLKRS